MKNETWREEQGALAMQADFPLPAAREVLRLLGSARVAIKLGCGDEFAENLLDEGMSHLRQRYGLSVEDSDRDMTLSSLGDDLVWAKSSLQTLVRMLLYVKAEVAENLRDETCANLLTQCIDRILQTKKLCLENIFNKSARASI